MIFLIAHKYSKPTKCISVCSLTRYLTERSRNASPPRIRRLPLSVAPLILPPRRPLIGSIEGIDPPFPHVFPCQCYRYDFRCSMSLDQSFHQSLALGRPQEYQQAVLRRRHSPLQRSFGCAGVLFSRHLAVHAPEWYSRAAGREFAAVSRQSFDRCVGEFFTRFAKSSKDFLHRVTGDTRCFHGSLYGHVTDAERCCWSMVVGRNVLLVEQGTAHLILLLSGLSDDGDPGKRKDET